MFWDWLVMNWMALALSGVTGALLTMFLGFLFSERREAAQDAERARGADLTLEGLKRQGLVAISKDAAQDIVDIFNKRVNGMSASFDPDIGLLCYQIEEDEPQGPIKITGIAPPAESSVSMDWFRRNLMRAIDAPDEFELPTVGADYKETVNRYALAKAEIDAAQAKAIAAISDHSKTILDNRVDAVAKDAPGDALKMAREWLAKGVICQAQMKEYQTRIISEAEKRYIKDHVEKATGPDHIEEIEEVHPTNQMSEEIKRELDEKLIRDLTKAGDRVVTEVTVSKMSAEKLAKVLSVAKRSLKNKLITAEDICSVQPMTTPTVEITAGAKITFTELESDDFFIPIRPGQELAKVVPLEPHPGCRDECCDQSVKSDADEFNPEED